jgi:AcrR family transcriptional regulator
VEQTRLALFQAALEQLSDAGLEDFNIPALAERAGVSVRTIYRYFPTKKDLLEQFGEWLDDQVAGTSATEGIETIEAQIAEGFAAFDDNEEIIRAQWVTPTGRKLREARYRARRTPYRRAIENAAPNLPAAEKKRALALLGYLVSSRTWYVMKDEYGLDGRESGKAVAWAIKLLMDDITRRSRKAAASSNRNGGRSQS